MLQFLKRKIANISAKTKWDINKFYPKCKVAKTHGSFVEANLNNGKRTNGFICEVVVSKYADGFKCPHCGGNPGPDSEQDYKSMYDPREGVNSMDNCCETCHRWWRITGAIGVQKALLVYNEAE